MTRPTSHTWKSCQRIGVGLILGLLSVVPANARQNDHERKVLKKVEPQYPSVLKSRGISGTVRLKVFVKADGTVRDVELLGGNPTLADAADKAVRLWKFAPGTESSLNIAVNFDPNS